MKRLLSILGLCLVAGVAFGQPQTTVDTISALTNRIERSGETVRVLGYYTPGDWGTPRDFRHVTNSSASQNGGNRFMSRSGRGRYHALDEYAPAQNVRWWGAVPNDGISDSAAFNLVLGAGYAEVVAPEGTYDIPTTVYVTNAVYFHGVQREQIVFRGGTSTNGILVMGNPWATNSTAGGGPVEGIHIADLFIYGNGSGAYPATYQNSFGIKIIGCVRYTLDNVRTTNLPQGHGVWIDQTSWIGSINNSKIFGAKWNIFADCDTSVSGTLVSALTFHNTELSGGEWGAVIGNPTNRYNQLGQGLAKLWLGATIEGNTVGGMWVNHADSLSVDCYFERNGEVDLRIGSNVETNSAGVDNIIVQGSRFGDSTNAIQVFSGRNVTIVNNRFLGNYGTNIVLYPLAEYCTVGRGNSSSRTSDGKPDVSWSGGRGTRILKDTVDHNDLPVLYAGENMLLGTGGLWLNGRLNNSRRWLAVGADADAQGGVVDPAGFYAMMLGTNARNARVYLRIDANGYYMGGLVESPATARNLYFENNGITELTLAPVKTLITQKTAIVTNDIVGDAALTVQGKIATGNPPRYMGAYTKTVTYGLTANSPNTNDILGVETLLNDGSDRRFFLRHILSSNFVEYGSSYSSGADLPLIFSTQIGGRVLTLDGSGVWLGPSATGTNVTTAIAGKEPKLPNGTAGQVWTSTGSTSGAWSNAAAGGGSGAAWNGVTNVDGVIQFNVAGSGGITVTTNSTTGQVTFSGPGASTNSGTIYSVDGTYSSQVNAADGSRIAVSLTGTNETWDIVAGSVRTNELAAAALSYLLNRTNHTGNLAWSFVTSTPTTLSGYGITDAQPLDTDLTRFATITGSQGDLVYRDSVGWTNLAKGTIGQYLAPTAAGLSWSNLPAGGGGSGLGTNLFVNGALQQPARLTNAPAATTGGVRFQINGNGDIEAYATNITTGGGSTTSNVVQRIGWARFEKVLDAITYSGIGKMTNYLQNVTVGGVLTNLIGSCDFTNSVRLTVDGQLSGVTSTNYWLAGTYITEYADPTNVLQAGQVQYPVYSDFMIMGSSNKTTSFRILVEDTPNKITSGITKTTNAYYLQVLDFVTVTAGGGGSGSPIGVNSGAGGAVTNFADSSSVTWTASSGSATAKTAHRNLAAWNAAQMFPGTTASSQPQFSLRGVGVPAYCFDPSTADLVLLQAEVPSGFNLSGGLELVVKVAPDAANPGTSNVVFQAQYQKLCCGASTIDSSSYSGAVTLTNRLTGASGVVTNLTFSLASWSGWAAGDTVQIELQRIAGATADDSTNRACVLSAQLNVISQ